MTIIKVNANLMRKFYIKSLEKSLHVCAVHFCSRWTRFNSTQARTVRKVQVSISAVGRQKISILSVMGQIRLRLKLDRPQVLPKEPRIPIFIYHPCPKSVNFLCLCLTFQISPTSLFFFFNF